MLRRPRRQPLLLDRYWNALVRDPGASPPAGLDSDLQVQTSRLAASATQYDADDRFARRLRAQIDAGAVGGTSRDWNRPSVAVLRIPTQHEPDADAHDEETNVSQINGMPENVPVPIHQRSRSRELMKIAAAALAFGLIGAILVLVLRDGRDSNVAAPLPTETATPASTPTSMPTSMPTREATPTEAAVVPAPTATEPVTATATTAPDEPAPPVAEYDAVIPVGESPFGIAAGAGGVWVPLWPDGTVQRIDPATNAVVATIQVMDPQEFFPASPAMVAVATDDAVWVTVSKGFSFDVYTFEVVRIDPATNSVVQRITLDAAPFFMAVGEGSVWITSLYDNRLTRIDEATGEVLATLDVRGATAVTTGAGSVWVMTGLVDEPMSILRIDPATNAIVATIPVSGIPDDSNDPFIWYRWDRLAFTDGSLWVSNPYVELAITRIDPATNAVIAEIQVGDPTAPANQKGPAGIAAGDGEVWTYVPYHGSPIRIDPATNSIVATYPKADGWQYMSIAIDAESVWIADYYGNTVARVNR